MQLYIAYPFPHVPRGVMIVQPRWGCFYKEICIETLKGFNNHNPTWNVGNDKKLKQTKNQNKNKMFQQFIRKPVLAIVISIVFVFTGMLSMSTLPKSQFPDIAPTLDAARIRPAATSRCATAQADARAANVAQGGF